MVQFGTVNYHVHKNERQAFVIDADGIPGNLISPDLAPTQITINDVRSLGDAPQFSKDAVEFAITPSDIRDFSSDGWQLSYDTELKDLLRDMLGAREVVVFDHTVRTDDPNSTRKPARNVHSDYSPDAAKARLVDVLGPEVAADWRNTHYAFVNVWRPVTHPINSAPLGFVRPSTVAAEDWILLDLIYPDRTGQIMGLVGNPDHEWLYLSKMTPDEVAVFNIYDSQGLPSIAHSAIDMVEDPAVTTVRKSIETRTLVRY